MADAIYDQIEIEDMTFDPALQIYHYPCPCGDRFEISIDDLRDGENIAVCPSCSLMIEVIFEPVCMSFEGTSGESADESWQEDLPGVPVAVEPQLMVMEIATAVAVTA